MLPNDPTFLRLTEDELAFTYHFLRSKEEAQYKWWLKNLPHLIGRAVGTYWTWEDFQEQNASLCVECLDSTSRPVPVIGGSGYQCSACKAVWPEDLLPKAKAASSPSTTLVPLAVLIAGAMNAKNPGEVIKAIGRKLHAPSSSGAGSDGKPAPSTVMVGARMMDERWGSKTDFIERIRQAQQAEAEEKAALDRLQTADRLSSKD